MKRSIPIPVLLPLLLTGGCDAPEPPPRVAAPAARLESREEGPFPVDNDEYTLVLGVLLHAGEETAGQFRIVDGRGVVQFEEEHDAPPLLDHGFEHTLHVSAVALAGVSGSALMLSRRRTPSAPFTGVTHQLFGVRAQRLVPLTLPVSYYGELSEPPLDAAARSVRLPDGDLLVLMLWRFHFGVMLPLRLDLACAPGADTCVQPAPRALPDAPGFGAMDVQVDLRSPAPQQFVTLLALPGADSGQHVAVHADSRIEVLEAAARIEMRSGDILEVVLRDEHLRIRIDGREGWVRGPEAFEAIGLPGAG